MVNGLKFEGWLDRLINSTDFDGMRVAATEGIEPIAFDDEHRESRLITIGRNIDELELRQQFGACIA